MSSLLSSAAASSSPMIRRPDNRLSVKRGSRAPGRPRFLSEAACQDIGHRLARFSKGGGYTNATIVSRWQGYIRWGRNRVSSSGDVRDDHVLVMRLINGAYPRWVEINDSSDVALVAAARRAERLAALRPAFSGSNLIQHYEPEPFVSPQLFFETTYQLDADHRTAAARELMQSASAAGMQSAGYIEVSAHSQAFITSYGYTRYFQYTWARYSVTVRDPKGTGSGWAGVDWPDWNKIDGAKLTQTALDKCLQSRNPVAIEPGRYTTILEPQAVSDFIGKLLIGKWFDPNMAPYQALDRWGNERNSALPFFWRADLEDKSVGYSQIGNRVIDQRITISSDPMDPELGFVPFQGVHDMMFLNPEAVMTDVYQPVTWIKDGVLTNLAYDRFYGMTWLGKNTGLPKQGAFRMSGGDTSVADMIATTKRGVLVTRFDGVKELFEGRKSLLCRGSTRDGLWLIENGKISKSIRNMRFVESILATLNSVEQLGVPQRVFRPAGHWWWNEPQPAIAPPMKVRDFSFTALTSAI